MPEVTVRPVQIERQEKPRKHNKLIATLGDAGGIIMALLYILYVGVMIGFEIGSTWLYILMFFITLAYIMFLLYKILYINMLDKKIGYKKIVKMSIKYGKLGMRAVNAIFVILSIITSQTDGDSWHRLISVIGIIALSITLLITIAWDMLMRFVKRKIREIREEWKSLKPEERKEKLDFYIDSIFNSLDNISGVGEYVDMGNIAGKLVAGRIEKLREEGSEGQPGSDGQSGQDASASGQDAVQKNSTVSETYVG